MGASRCARRASLPDVLGTHLLLATGRKPNTADLGLDRAGIATDARGYITVNDRLETNVAGVWALGDATAAARSRTPRTTTTRSSPATCCATSSAC